MKSEEFVKKVHVSEIVGPSSRERPLGRWKDRVKEYVCVKKVLMEGVSKQGGSFWTGRGGGSSAMTTPLGSVHGRSQWEWKVI